MHGISDPAPWYSRAEACTERRKQERGKIKYLHRLRKQHIPLRQKTQIS